MLENGKKKLEFIQTRKFDGYKIASEKILDNDNITFCNMQHHQLIMVKTDLQKNLWNFFSRFGHCVLVIAQ